MFVEEILFVICARYWGVIQAESKIYCILEADLLLSVHQSSFNNKRAAQLQFCISNSCRIGLSSSPSQMGVHVINGWGDLNLVIVHNIHNINEQLETEQ